MTESLHKPQPHTLPATAVAESEESGDGTAFINEQKLWFADAVNEIVEEQEKEDAEFATKAGVSFDIVDKVTTLPKHLFMLAKNPDVRAAVKSIIYRKGEVTMEALDRHKKIGPMNREMKEKIIRHSSEIVQFDDAIFMVRREKTRQTELVKRGRHATIMKMRNQNAALTDPKVPTSIKLETLSHFYMEKAMSEAAGLVNLSVNTTMDRSEMEMYKLRAALTKDSIWFAKELRSLSKMLREDESNFIEIKQNPEAEAALEKARSTLKKLGMKEDDVADVVPDSGIMESEYEPVAQTA